MESTTCFDGSENPPNWIVVASAFVVVIAATFLIAAWPRENEPVAVVFPPWVTPGTAFNQVTQAGGRPLDLGGLMTVVIALPPDAESGPWRPTGALMVLGVSLSSALCVQRLETS